MCVCVGSKRPVGLKSGWFLGFGIESFVGCCDCEGVGLCIESLLKMVLGD